MILPSSIIEEACSLSMVIFTLDAVTLAVSNSVPERLAVRAVLSPTGTTSGASKAIGKRPDPGHEAILYDHLRYGAPPGQRALQEQPTRLFLIFRSLQRLAIHCDSWSNSLRRL